MCLGLRDTDRLGKSESIERWYMTLLVLVFLMEFVDNKKDRKMPDLSFRQRSRGGFSKICLLILVFIK